MALHVFCKAKRRKRTILLFIIIQGGLNNEFPKYIKKTMVALGSIILVPTIFYLEFGGIYHAFKKHGNTDGWIAVCVPPYTFYRALEWFWHDDYAGIDWNKQINYDLDATFGVFEAYIDKDNLKIKSELGEMVNDLSQRFSSYKPDKLLIIKNTTRAYMLYGLSVAKDSEKYIEELLQGAQIKFSFGPRTLQLEKDFVQVSKQEAYITRSKEFILDTMNQFEATAKLGFTEEQTKNTREALKSQYAETRYRTDKARTLYKDLFNEELDLSLLEN